MGYMEGNINGMDYTYGNSSHYPLWKPPSGYFPRGEAPPPYEEAVALSQAEALSAAQCTVSVATTTHRSLPISTLNVAEGEIHQPQNPQQQNITTSTTNLINININSGGNVTTVATGESHQPPYSQQPRSTQTQSTCSSSSSSIGEPSNLHLQQHHPIQRNNQIMPGSNSVCVQASGPLQAVVQPSQTAAHHNSTLQTLQPYTSYQTQIQPTEPQIQQHQTQQSSINTIAASSTLIGGNNTLGQHQSVQPVPQHQIAQIQTIECSYKNCTLNNASSTSSTSKILSSSKSHRITAPDNISQYNAAVAAAAAATEASSQVTGGASNNTTNSNQNKYTTILPPPLFDEGATTNNLNIDQQQNLIANDSNGVCNANNVSSGANLKTPSSSRRYHRTIPRHLTAIDPLISAVNISGSGTLPAGSTTSGIKYASENGSNIQVSKNVLNSTSNTTGSSNSEKNLSSNNKKPTCQCPVQHVPMSYMGTNHISNHAQNSNIFLSTITNKLARNSSGCNNNSNSNSSNFKTKSPCGSKSLSQSKDSLNESSRSSTLKRSGHSSNSHHSSNHHGNSNSSGCSPSTPSNTKISTISKHVGEIHSSANNQVMLKATPVLKQKHSPGNSIQHQQISHNSSVNILRNGDGGDLYNSSSFPIQLMESLSKISTESNPVLPPKMYKTSQSNCSKSQHVYTAVSKIHTISKPNDNSIITSAHNHHHSHHYHSGPQRSSSTSRCTANGLLASSNSSNSYTKSLSRKDNELKSITPALTLPASNCIINLNNENKSQSLGKINSSTFYPMQNSHVTYTLPKHHPNGKQSLNSTIASVVSKVPSVISIPSTSMIALENATLSLVAAAANISEREMSSSKAEHIQPTSDCKRSTLPKVIKNQQQHHNDKTPTHSDFKNNENDKPLPVCTTSKNCSNPKEHFLPNDTSLDDDYLSECENCKTAHSSKYYLNDEETEEPPQETMTLQRNKDQDKEDEQAYYRTSLTLPTNTKKTTNIKNNRETWFSSIPASSSSDEEINE
ncbi:putative uncharacterized protein DDB_G0282133 isoform X2 [Condylostylus longicornis]|uniref:putative uncharacterized protein DDB_G0282133 isoform X2 n=1 Tax=Condylostylus longicornis TaxID=2530218 RepID=UPI00244E452A|nr:putative uncharacterized protein DDB_G0282133 isoform X2 [Condylostylus longicornis]